MFLVWHGEMHRPTRDIDLLGFVEADEARLIEVMQSVCTVQVEDDGVLFEPISITVEKIREETAYGGLRCLIPATLGSAKLRVQLDVGFGDDVTPQPDNVTLPKLLDDEVPREIKAYTWETVVAEKFETIVRLGLANSRMKDYLDLHVILKNAEIDSQTLAEAIRRTFRRRQTTLPLHLPTGLTEEFWRDDTAQRRSAAFLRKNRVHIGSLEEICRAVGQRMGEILHIVREQDGSRM